MKLLRTLVVCGLGLFGLAACGASTPTVATDVAALANAVKAAIALYPAGTIPASATGYITTVETAADALATASANGASTASLSSQIVTASEAVLPILAAGAQAIPVYGPQIALALGAVDVLLPAVITELSGVNVAGAEVPTAAVAALPAVSLSDARAKFAPTASSRW